MVDDDPEVTRLASRVLGEAGFEVLAAEDGGRTASIVNNQRVDLVITDLDMPGQAGLEAILALRRSKPSLPIIAIPEVFCEQLLKTATTFGAQDAVAKPIAAAELLDAVYRVLQTGTLKS